ncbi:hypothetical protein Acr_24g0006080 [Actinidia rufa]|uniref:RNase H type-1 domain-containing protein n=1 Tax=Actinidia rufa TaxID=165716 RepID=A0A7J0GUF5_9ERIC|nr:hypothetical protein Acr_24g0006080 [Actinidia rufa]
MGLVLQTPSGKQMEYAIRIGFKATNNEAKYKYLLAEFRVTTELGVESFDAFNDSQLVVNQVQGNYIAKDLLMVAYLDEVKAMSTKIKDFKICQIPREKNKKADALANLTLAFDFVSNMSVPLEFLKNPSIEIIKSVCQTEGLDLRSRRLFTKDISSLKWNETGQHTQENVTNARDLLYTVAKEVPNRHHRLFHQIGRGATSRQNHIEKTPEILYGRALFAVLGFPRFSSRTTQSNSTTTNSNCSYLTISHHFFTPGHPKENDQVEITNRTILRNLKARLEKSKSEWVEDLPSILWAYHTTSRIPTGEMPYSMVYGIELVIPMKIGMPSFRTSNFDEGNNEAKIRLNLDFFEEKREKVTPSTKEHNAGKPLQSCQNFQAGGSIGWMI